MHNQPTIPPLKRAIAINPTLINSPKKQRPSLLKKLSFFSLLKSKSSTVFHEINLEGRKNEVNLSIASATDAEVTTEDPSYSATNPIQSKDASALDSLQQEPLEADYDLTSSLQSSSATHRDIFHRARQNERFSEVYESEEKDNSVIEVSTDGETSPASSTTTDFRIPRRGLPPGSPFRSGTRDSTSTTMSFVSLNSNSIITVDSPIKEVLDLYHTDVEAVESEVPQPVSKASQGSSSSTESPTKGLDSFIPPTRIPSLPLTDTTEKDPLGGILVRQRPDAGNISPQKKVSFNFGKRPPTSAKFALQSFMDQKRQMEEDRILAEELQRLEVEGGYDVGPKPNRRHFGFQDLKARRERLQRIEAEDALLAAEIYRCEQEDFAFEQRQRDQKEKVERERLLAIERQKQEDQARLLAEQTRLITQIGAPIGVRRANLGRGLTEGSLTDLTPDIIERLQHVKFTFSRSLPLFRIQKVEWIVNERLQADFENCREQLRRCGRPTNELLLWHGTAPQNLFPYVIENDTLTESILTGGFRLGGVGGHFIAHGQSKVLLLLVYLTIRA
jgi:hypothetical protein